MAFGTLILAAATIILGFATVFLWHATKSLVRGADKTAERQLRAYVFARPLSFDMKGEKGQFSIRYMIGNTGQTPAHNLRHSGAIAILPYPLPKDFIVKSPTEFTGGMSIGNGGTVLGQATETVPGTIGFQSIVDMQRAGNRFYLVAIVKYFDVFAKEERVTRICAAIANLEEVMRASGAAEGKTSTGGVTQEIEFDHPAQHNDAS